MKETLPVRTRYLRLLKCYFDRLCSTLNLTNIIDLLPYIKKTQRTSISYHKSPKRLKEKFTKQIKVIVYLYLEFSLLLLHT